MRFACSLQVFASLFFAFFAYFRFKFFATIRFKHSCIQEFLVWMKERKVSIPHKSPASPQLPKFVEAVLYEIRYRMCSLLSIEWTTHRNHKMNYWNACILLCIVVDPWHFGMDLDPRIQITDLWIRFRILLFTQVTDKMPTNFFFFFFQSNLLIHQSSKIKSKK